MPSLRILLSNAGSKKWNIQQLDVSNWFLHGNLYTIVYMHQLPGYIDPWQPNHVCLLQKALYGHKQAPR